MKNGEIFLNSNPMNYFQLEKLIPPGETKSFRHVLSKCFRITDQSIKSFLRDVETKLKRTNQINIQQFSFSLQGYLMKLFVFT